jgi:hypothetical protein
MLLKLFQVGLTAEAEAVDVDGAEECIGPRDGTD